MKECREERERNKERLEREEAILNGAPNAELTPRTFGKKIIEPCMNVKAIIESSYGRELDVESKNRIKDTLKRAIVKSIPHYKQEFAFRLIKLHQIDYGAWNTETIRWLYEYLDLSE